MTRAIPSRVATLDAISDAQQVLGCAMYRLEWPRRYWWFWLTFRRRRIYRESQEWAAWLAAIYGSGPFVGPPRWADRRGRFLDTHPEGSA